MHLSARVAAALTRELDDHFTEADYTSLFLGQWITDHVIDFHSRYLELHIVQPTGKRIRILTAGMAQLLVHNGEGGVYDAAARARNQAVFNGTEGTPDIFVPLNKAADKTQSDGLHWSLLHIHVTHGRLFHAYHYDPAGEMNKDIALAVIHAFRDHLGLDPHTNLIPAQYCPQDKTGTECGPFVTRMMRALVTRICHDQWQLSAGQANLLDDDCRDDNDGGRAIWFPAKSLQNCRKERDYLCELFQTLRAT